MDTSGLLKDKVVLVVDDEVDVTDTVEEVLDMCFIRKANDYDTARQYLLSYTFDIVVLVRRKLCWRSRTVVQRAKDHGHIRVAILHQ